MDKKWGKRHGESESIFYRRTKWTVRSFSTSRDQEEETIISRKGKLMDNSNDSKTVRKVNFVRVDDPKVMNVYGFAFKVRF